MWLNTRDADDGADASHQGSVWAYGGQSPPSPSPAAAAPSSLSAIGLGGAMNGSAQWRSRLLWNRTEPEEEEREEEALPSYLSYLQHPLTLRSEPVRSSANSTTSSPRPPPPGMTSSSSTAVASASNMRAYGAFAVGSPRAVAPASGSEIEEKSKKLAFALQDFILTQMQQSGATPQSLRPHPPLPPKTPATSSTSQSPTSNACGCGCDSLRVRVSELTHQVHALQGQVTSLLKSTGSLSSSAQSFVPPGGSAGGNAGGGGMMAPMPPLPPPPSPHHHQHHHLQVNLPAPLPLHHPQQPPMPVAPPPSPVGSAGSAGSTLTDRVSTLEGRQSAFQSQLAQIAKVLGMPAGKQSKNTQLKTLVQTLREEIDAKFEAVTNEMEISFAANVRDQAKQDAIEALDARMRDLASEMAAASPSSSSPSSSPTASSSLSYDAILTALASEHEASLARLSAAFQELVGEESKQRAQLEQRVESHFSRHEEWLQQLEGELGSRFELPPFSASGDWAAAVKGVDEKLSALAAACEENRAQWRKLLADASGGEARAKVASSARDAGE